MFRPKSSSANQSSGSNSRTRSRQGSLLGGSGPLPATFSDRLPLPKLFVFDLDYTLWPFWVDTHVMPPLKAQDGGMRVKDQYGESFNFHGHVGGILAVLCHLGIKVAAASRTHTPDLAREMLKLLRIQPVYDTLSVRSAPAPSKAIDFFDSLQIFPGSKIQHFENLRQATGLEYEEMLFFDDEARNRDVESLGVVMWLVRDGVTCDEIDKGVRSWRQRNRREAQ